MTDQALDDYRKTEELYAPLLAALRASYGRGHTLSDADARRALDGVFSIGKAIGRRTALRAQNRPVENDALYNHWMDCAERSQPT